MKELCDDLLAEYRQLASLVEAMTPRQWGKKTLFYDWTPWDQIAHLCFFDESALLAAKTPEAFVAETAELQKQLGGTVDINTVARARFGHFSAPGLIHNWRRRFEALAALLSAMDPKTRLPWYGPAMSVRSFATARMMETWAHGQDVFDLTGHHRQVGDGIKNIAHLGVSTYGWAFVNRNLAIPEPAPYIELQAPSGASWVWNGPSSDRDYLRGSAEEFCLVVTQRRNAADTGLQFGGTAAQWLPIAQCFAGPPEDPPAPGARAIRR